MVETGANVLSYSGGVAVWLVVLCLGFGPWIRTKHHGSASRWMWRVRQGGTVTTYPVWNAKSADLHQIVSRDAITTKERVAHHDTPATLARRGRRRRNAPAKTNRTEGTHAPGSGTAVLVVCPARIEAPAVVLIAAEFNVSRLPLPTVKFTQP